MMELISKQQQLQQIAKSSLVVSDNVGLLKSLESDKESVKIQKKAQNCEGSSNQSKDDQQSEFRQKSIANGEEDQDLSGNSSDDEFEEESEGEGKQQQLFMLDKLMKPRPENAPEINQSQLSMELKDQRGERGLRGIADQDNKLENISSQNNLLSLYDDEEQEIRRNILDSVPTAIPIITSQFSLKPDMMFGWKPSINITGAPIPLYFDYEWFDIPINPLTGEEYDISFYGHRFKDSLEMHKAYANKSNDSYKFKFPPNMNVLEAMAAGQKRKREEIPREFSGMNPLILAQEGYLNPRVFSKQSLHFDSRYESGNLDMVIQVKDLEYDLYMRVDSNTRGHHQWFNFTVMNNSVKGRVKFNIVNFTKNASLYHQGMKINILSKRHNDILRRNKQNIENEGWTKGGENIVYKLSKLSQVPYGQRQVNVIRYKKYFQLSFEYDFQHENDTVQFSYSVPYTFSRLYNLVKSLVKEHSTAVPEAQNQFLKEGQLCKSISGLEVPILTVTSRVNKQNYEEIDNNEFLTSEIEQESSPPLNKYKKYIIVCSRVHPGETNASFIMEGFLKFITSQTNPEAIELRKRIIFKIVPMTNPDGVIVGNYRTGLCGNDLNRQFITPNTKLHPTVCSIKQLVSDIITNAKEPEPITSFIDIHGHSRKKSIFIYGPYFPLHNERYLKMRVLPKLLSERTEMFRFFSCKFRIQKSKLKAARVVLWKEFGIMNCFTLEASFHGFINKERSTIPLTTENLQKMGEILGGGFYEYQILVEEDDKQKLILKQQIKNKKKKIKAKDLVQAYSKQQETQILDLTKQVEGTTPGQFLSDLDERKNNTGTVADRQNSHSLVKTKDSQANRASIASSSGAGGLQKRAQSLAIKEQSNPLQTQDGKLEKSQIQIGEKEARKQALVETVIEAKRSSAEENSSKNSTNRNEQTSSLRDASDDDPSKRKPFRIKKQKIPIQGFLKKENGEKRTLKSIYKLLKRDMKNLASPNKNENGQTQTQAESSQLRQNKNGNISSESDDSDDDGLDCCENEDSDANDDLTPSELEELQTNIIEAIENFDKMYNKSALKGKKGKKKSKAAVGVAGLAQNELSNNLKSLQIDQSQIDDSSKFLAAQLQKEPASSKGRQKILNGLTQNSANQQQAIQILKQQQQTKRQQQQLGNQFQIHNINSTRIRQIESVTNVSQYQKFMNAQPNSSAAPANQTFNTYFPLQVSGMLVRQSQQQNAPTSMNRRKLQSKELNRSNPVQNEILNQGLSSNVRNLIRFVNPQINSSHPRNSAISESAAQILTSSKSQEKYRKSENIIQNSDDSTIMKSFENFSNKFQSKSTFNRPPGYQNKLQVHESLQRSQIVENNQRILGLSNFNNLQSSGQMVNSRINQAAQSKSSRVILGTEASDKPMKESLQMTSTSSGVNNTQEMNRFANKNSQIHSIRTPKGSFLQKQGTLILNTPKNNPSLIPITIEDKDKTTTNSQTATGMNRERSSITDKNPRAYSFTAQINNYNQAMADGGATPNTGTGKRGSEKKHIVGIQSHQNILTAGEELRPKRTMIQFKQSPGIAVGCEKELLTNKTVVHSTSKFSNIPAPHQHHQSFGNPSQSQDRLNNFSFKQEASEFSHNPNIKNLINFSQQNIFKQNIFQNVDQALSSLNQLQQQQLGGGQNQSLIIQNIIIGNYHNDQRIQYSSPQSQMEGSNGHIKGELNREDIIQRHKKKRKKSKRKSKDNKKNSFGAALPGGYQPQNFDASEAYNNSHIQKHQYSVIGTTSNIHPIEFNRNSFANQSEKIEPSQKTNKTFNGLKYIGLPSSSSTAEQLSMANSNNPYKESINQSTNQSLPSEYKPRRNQSKQVGQVVAQTNATSNLFISEGEDETKWSHSQGIQFNVAPSNEDKRGRVPSNGRASFTLTQFNQKRQSDKSGDQSLVNGSNSTGGINSLHQKKFSIEYDQLVKFQDRESLNGVFGPGQIYNLKPLKDMIQTNLNQVKYVKPSGIQDIQQSAKRGSNIQNGKNHQQYVHQKIGVASQGFGQEQMINQQTHQQQLFVVPSTAETGRMGGKNNMFKPAPARQIVATFPSQKPL